MPQRLNRYVARVRQELENHARLIVLALGDSHVRVFEHWWFLAVELAFQLKRRLRLAAARGLAESAKVGYGGDDGRHHGPFGPC
jgi:hypothetical protein